MLKNWIIGMGMMVLLGCEAGSRTPNVWLQIRSSWNGMCRRIRPPVRL